MVDAAHSAIESDDKPRRQRFHESAHAFGKPVVDFRIAVAANVADRKLVRFDAVDVGRDSADQSVPFTTLGQQRADRPIRATRAGRRNPLFEFGHRTAKSSVLLGRKQTSVRLPLPRRRTFVDAKTCLPRQ